MLIFAELFAFGDFGERKMWPKEKGDKCKVISHLIRAIIMGNQNDGGEDGIRTHDTLLTYTPLAGERLRPLGHLSGAA